MRHHRTRLQLRLQTLLVLEERPACDPQVLTAHILRGAVDKKDLLNDPSIATMNFERVGGWDKVDFHLVELVTTLMDSIGTVRVLGRLVIFGAN